MIKSEAMRRACLFGIFLWLAATLIAQQPAEVMDQANNAYREEDYARAIQLYEGILKINYGSAPLYYNLGNAYFKSGDLGRAIWSYERGLLLSPRDADLRHNLGVARSRQTDDLAGLRPFFLTRWWGWLRSWLGPGGWSVASLLCMWLGVAGLGLWRLGKDRSWRVRGFAFGFALLLGSLLTLALSWSARNWQRESGYAVLLPEEAALREAPDPLSEEVLSLHAGLKVKTLDRIGEWYKVQLSDGQLGWLPAEALGVVGLER